jgi:PAS domain S-box-containing protein
MIQSADPFPLAPVDGSQGWLVGGGEAGRLLRAMDWSRHPLGPIAGWPPSLRTAVNLCLDTRHPAAIWWGPGRIMFYNDGYRPMLGQDKHPQFLGGSGQACWSEIWSIIGPMMDQVIATGEATWSEDMLLLMLRSGYLEETYFTFSYSPIRDETGTPMGIFDACTESTARVLGERRLRTLREMTVEARIAREAAALCAEALGHNPQDIPFALVYLLDSAESRLELAGCTGLEPGARACPPEAPADRPDPAGWPLAQVLAEERAVLVEDLDTRFPDLPTAPWGEPAHRAVVLPLPRPGSLRPAGALVLGISPRLAFDDPYQGFFDLVAGHIATAVANARAYEEDNRTAELLKEVAERKEAERKLNELSQRLTYHVDHSPLAVIEWGPDMRLNRWSGEAERMFGWTAAEVLGKRMEDFNWIYQEDQEQVADVSRSLASGSEPRRFSANRNYRKDGSVVYCEWYNSSLVDESGALRSILSLVLDVTERKRMEAALKTDARRKDDFLAVLGHELRNPLAPIRNAVHVIRRAGGSPDLVESACAIVERQVAHLTRLVDELLDITRIVRGKVHLRPEAFDLGAAVATLLEDYRPVLDQAGLVLELDLPAGPVPIKADRARVIQAVSNLLHNACKFTDPGGRIRVGVALEAPAWCRVQVEDTGLGIPADMLGWVFEPFTQRKETVGRSNQGLGLGLALAKGLAELHGGTLSVRSEGRGRGSTFTLRLPAPEAAGAPAPGPAAPASGPFRRRRIMIVEDLPDAATTMKLLLSMLGHDTETAPDGRSALARAAQFGPEIILCDIGLPGGMDGYALARALRSTPGLEGAYMVALTGFGTPTDIELARQAGFDAHLTKPVDPAALGPLIENIP